MANPPAPQIRGRGPGATTSGLETPVEELADHARVALVLGRGHRGTQEEVALLLAHLVVPRPVLLDDPGVRGDHRVHRRAELVRVADLGEAALGDDLAGPPWPPAP